MSETLIPPHAAPDGPWPPASLATPPESSVQPAEAEIDHPHHHNWWTEQDNWLAANEDDLKQNLQARFPLPESEFEALWKFTATGITLTNAYRTTHEQSNKALVARYWEHEPGVGSLETLSPAAEYALRRVELQKGDGYNTLAGRDATLERYIPWVGRAALATITDVERAERELLPTLRDADARRRAAKRFAERKRLSLEIGGVSQAGNWDGTARLDGIVAALPDRLRQAQPDLRVEEFPHDAKRSYQFIPMREMVGRELPVADLSAEEYELYAGMKLLEWEFEDVAPEFAMIRRRRPLFDVHVPNGELVRVFKQSVGLLVLGELPEKAREIARAAAAAYPNYDALPTAQQEYISQRQQQVSTVAAAICGAVFERAIREREASTMVVPLSMQAIMKVKRPDAAPTA